MAARAAGHPCLAGELLVTMVMAVLAPLDR